MLVIVSLISKVIICIGATDDSTSEEIGFTCFPAKPGGVTASAADEGRILLDGHDGSHPVMDLPWVVVPVPNHVARGSGVVSQDIVHLRFRKGEEF